MITVWFALLLTQYVASTIAFTVGAWVLTSDRPVATRVAVCLISAFGWPVLTLWHVFAVVAEDLRNRS